MYWARWGGTKTVFAACDLRGTVLGLVETGGTNPPDHAEEKRAIIKEGVTALRSRFRPNPACFHLRESLVSHLTN